MKKLSFRSIIVVVTLVSIFFTLGCGSYKEEGERYQLEKALFNANKRMESFSVKPEMRTTSDFVYLVDGYRKVYQLFLSYFPDLANKDSLTTTEQEAAFLAGRALSTAATTYIGGDELDSANAILQLIIDTPYFAKDHHNQALLLSGRIANNQGRWLVAENEYLQLLKSFYPPAVNSIYPAREVIELPQTIVAHYVALGDQDMAQDKVNWAIGYYSSLVQLDTLPKYAGTPLILTATRLLAEMYNSKGEYQRSVDLLSSLKDSTGQIVLGAKQLIADLYFTRLNRQRDAISLYQDILENDTDSVFVPSVLGKLARIAIATKEYDQAHEFIQQLKKGFPRSPDIQLQAQLLLANSYEDEGEWNRALQEYQFLLTQFPDSPEALNVLVYLPSYCAKMNQPELEETWAGKAEERLKEVTREYAGRSFGLMGAAHLASFYVMQKRFGDALEQLQQLRTQYPKSAQATDALLKIGQLYQNELKEPQKALETYKEFVKLYPNSIVRPKVEDEIKKLEQG
jgi:tetratricopeptide (TPR) repeat protein